MGYAMFAARKVMMTDQVNMTNLELTKITNQIMDLSELSAAVSDGDISAFDIAECKQAGIAISAGYDMATGKYKDGEYYLGLLGAEKEARQMTGGSWMANICGAGAGAAAGFFLGGPVGALIGGIGGAILGNQCSAKTQQRNKYMKQYKEEYAKKKQEEIARELQDKIAKMENELEKRKAKIETKLKVYERELQRVEQAETQGIERSMPKYSGIQ